MNLAREKYLKSKWGLSLEAYEIMLAEQDGVCGICRKPPKPGTHLVIDHDHKSKVIRGLLCAWDNHYTMGRLTLERARAVVAYLERGGNYGQVPLKTRSHSHRSKGR